MMDDLIYIMKKQNEDMNVKRRHCSLKQRAIGMSNKVHLFVNTCTSRSCLWLVSCLHPSLYHRCGHKRPIQNWRTLQ